MGVEMINVHNVLFCKPEEKRHLRAYKKNFRLILSERSQNFDFVERLSTSDRNLRFM